MPAFHVIHPAPWSAPARPSIEPLHALTPVEWHPVRNLLAGQDSLVGSSRRPILAFGLEGAETWPWDETDAVSEWPQQDEWRVVGRDHVARLTPGSFLRLHVLHVPSGNTAAGPELEAYPDGWIRLEVTWSLGAASSGPHTYDLQLPAVAADGLLPTGAGAVWGQVRELELAEIWPPGVDNDLATAEDFSEGVRATISVYVRGGARVIDAVVVEHPLRHVQAHDSTAAVSCHAALQGGHVPLPAMTPVPQVERRDAPAFDERRWGSHHQLRVAHQQAETLGPRLLSWSPWASDGESFEQLNSYGEDDVEPVVIASDTFVDIITGAPGYDPERPGWLVHASHAQLHRYCDPALVMAGGGRAVVPVRCIVRARCQPSDDPPGDAVLRLQSSATEWTDVTFPADGEPYSLEVLGWLESQVAADHAVAVLQALARRTELAILYIYGIDIDWGWTP